MSGGERSLKKYVILLAAGKGSRMQTSVPKQFLLLNGEPMFSHSIKAFIAAVPEINIVLVLLEGFEKVWQQSVPSITNVKIVTGGETRFASVKNALDSLSGDALVAIHDAARPFVSPELISNAFKAAEKFGSAVPGIPVSDSLLYSDVRQTKSMRRENYFLAQTPQCYDLPLIKKAYQIDFQSHFTDDASVWEAAGNRIHSISGDLRNFKITTKTDYQLAQLITKSIDPLD